MSKNRPGPDTSDLGTDRLSNHLHSVLERSDPNDISTTRVRVENDIIGWYHRRDYLTQHQADALTKWQSDAYLSGIMPSCTGSFEPSISGGHSEISDTRIAAQKRRSHAIAMLDKINHDLTLMVDAVAVKGISAGRYMLTRFGGSPQEGLEQLVKAATILSRHYGLTR